MNEKKGKGRGLTKSALQPIILLAHSSVRPAAAARATPEADSRRRRTRGFGSRCIESCKFSRGDTVFTDPVDNRIRRRWSGVVVVTGGSNNCGFCKLPRYCGQSDEVEVAGEAGRATTGTSGPARGSVTNAESQSPGKTYFTHSVLRLAHVSYIPVLRGGFNRISTRTHETLSTTPMSLILPKSAHKLARRCSTRTHPLPPPRYCTVPLIALGEDHDECSNYEALTDGTHASCCLL
ncbi:hypothetical protein B0H11DRAFT_1929906 [Mycena galericulata]|nr:hypothetical protein B0H11DRAFT_1929906 [Mycena galericulata]